jgi:malate/lactate dehydrogenase
MAKAIVKYSQELFAVSEYSEGAYSLTELCNGALVRLGRGDAEKTFEFDQDRERHQFR